MISAVVKQINSVILYLRQLNDSFRQKLMIRQEVQFQSHENWKKAVISENEALFINKIQNVIAIGILIMFQTKKYLFAHEYVSNHIFFMYFFVIIGLCIIC